MFESFGSRNPFLVVEIQHGLEEVCEYNGFILGYDQLKSFRNHLNNESSVSPDEHTENSRRAGRISRLGGGDNVFFCFFCFVCFLFFSKNYLYHNKKNKKNKKFILSYFEGNSN